MSWTESLHPRASKGSPTGGQFVGSGRSKAEATARYKGAAKWPDLTKGAKLTNEQAGAVRTYLENHEEIAGKLWEALDTNSFLTGKYSVELKPELAEAVNVLDKAIGSHELAKDTTLYRMVTGQQREDMKTFIPDSHSIKSANFVSATDDPRLLLAQRRGDASLMEITAAAGTHALDIGKVKQEAAVDLFDKQMREVMFAREQEMNFKGYDQQRDVFSFQIGKPKSKEAGEVGPLGYLGIEGMKVDTSAEYVDYSGSELTDIYPQLGNYEVAGNSTHSYNCIAFALGDNKKWWWPSNPNEDDPFSFWPEEAQGEDVADSFDKLLVDIAGGKRTENTKPEKGFTKLALYVESDGTPTHLARQLPDGRWGSKLGSDILLIHDEPDALEESSYGNVRAIYKVPTKAWQKIRKMN